MAHLELLTITVPADVAEQVQSRIAQGRYATDGDVLREAMLALERQEKLRALRVMVEASITDPRPGVTADEAEDWLDQRAQSYGVRGDHA